MKRQKSLLSLLLALLMVCNMIVPVSAEGANEPILTVTASKTELDVSEGTADVIYTVSLNPNGNNICAFQFELTAPDGMKLTQDKAKKEGAEGYWINNKLRYVEEYNEDGLFTTFEYAPKTGYFGASGGLADRCLTETATIMTIKATVDVSNAKTYTLGVSKFICYGAGSVNFGGAAPAVTDVVVKGAAHTHDFTKVEAKAPSCERDGCILHWICYGCDQRFFDNNGAPGAEAKLEDVILPATGHAYGDLIPEVSATCGKDGVKAHYECSVCHKNFDTNYAELTDLVIPATGKHIWDLVEKEVEGATTHTKECKVCGMTEEETHDKWPGDYPIEWTSNDDYHWHQFACGTIMNKAAHTWDAGVETTPATCTTDGVKTYTCGVCQATKTETLKAAGHKLTKTEAKDATCTEPGNSEYYTCATCGKFFSDADGKNVIDEDSWITKALGHAYGEPAWSWSEDGKTATATFTCANNSEHTSTEQATIASAVKKAASCIEMGTTTYTATVTFENKDYKATKDVEDIAKIAHTLTPTVAKAATCTESGNNAYWTCDTCGQVFKDEQGTQPTTVDAETINATGHTPKTDWATDGDYHWHVCDKCGAVVGDKAAHTFDTNDCTKDRKCTECNYEKKAGQHTWGEKTYTWSDDFKCTATTKCISCQKPLTETVDGVKTTVPATCVADGKDIYTATFTNTAFETKTKEVTIDKLGHTYGAPVWSWSEDGKTATATFTCTREGCTAETTGHAQTVTATVSGKQTTAPTCTDKGTTTYTAKVTFETKDYTDTKDVQDIKALGHTLTKTPAKAATCTEPGNSEYYTCGTCGKFFSDKDGKTEIAKDSWVIKALGHKLTQTTAVTPTCVAGGNYEYWTCSVCHKVFKADKTTETTVAKETLAKDPANHTGGTELRGAVAASCMTAGRTADTYCKGCGKLTKAGDLIPPTGKHNYKDGVCTTCGNKQPADNATIEAAIKKVVADVKEAVEEVLDKAIKNETDANTKKILEKLKGYVSGSSRSKLQAVYSVTMNLNGQDLDKGDSLADGQNVTIAISEETYNALKSGAKIVESYLDDKGEAQTREINATLKQVGDGYTVTFAADKTAVYGLMTKTSSGGSSGSGSSYTSGQSFTTDLPADSINRVTVNGKKLDSKYYTVSSNGSGSIVTLTDAYLATLKAGKYTVKIENKTHVSTGTFTIKADGTLSSPKTADAGIALYAMLAVSSLMGTAVVSKKRRKA